MSSIRHHETKSGASIAYVSTRRKGPSYSSSGLFWLGGFKSSMEGSKATALSRWARAKHRECVRFDYSGHGASPGELEEGTISKWLGEATEIFDEITTGPQILIGSSMGGWLALLLLRQHLAMHGAGNCRIRGMILIAPATDMTEELMWACFSDEVREEILSQGVHFRPSAYGEDPYPITRDLIEDGRNNLLLDRQTEVPCPVHILQGLEDPDVPWAHAARTAKALNGEDIAVTMIRNGDHRLSRDEDVLRLVHLVEAMINKVDRR